ncbi:hypothetical protein SAMN05444339_10271 [Loktanella atrilutea]|uniref:Phage head-tail joining protein n=1 Tax=Loktanella atrilutea TaxID=366533 RepID=A0A1M4WD10_LOKAT|nr:hypothetical protein [Loktanella atrilutea]SHE79065.1 hypothetical protein SAMN05444339_10271 [Loktanella atrilutea]
MVARYGEIQARAISAVDSVMSEDILHFPLVGGIVDTSRERLTFTAVVRVGTNEERNVSGGRAQSWGGRMNAGKARAYIDLATEPLPFFKEHDKIRLIDRDGQPFFEILNITDRQSGRMILHLGAV